MDYGSGNDGSLSLGPLVSREPRHIAAVCLAHVLVLRAFQEKGLALRSQIPMLVLMVGYTMISLWILAQPRVER